MSYKFNPFTGTLDLIDTSAPNKIEYTNENITVATNNFITLIEPVLVGTSTITLNGTSILRIE